MRIELRAREEEGGLTDSQSVSQSNFGVSPTGCVKWYLALTYEQGMVGKYSISKEQVSPWRSSSPKPMQ